MSTLLWQRYLWVLIVCQAFYVNDSWRRRRRRRRSPPPPCSWKTCTYEWTNSYQPAVPQGECLTQTQTARVAYATHTQNGGCPSSQTCSTKTASRVRCSCYNAYSCSLRAWTSWAGHVPDNKCVRQTRSRSWNEVAKYVERDSANCNGIRSSCGTREYDYRTYCHVPNNQCSRQTRYRDWSEAATYIGRSNSCNGVRSSCGGREHDYRTYCSCPYAQCRTLEWTSWSEIKPEIGHCRTEARYQRHVKTIVYKTRPTNCDGVGPQICQPDITSKREKVVYCAPLQKPSVGKWGDDSCFQSRQRCKFQCTLECTGMKGYQRVGSNPTITCQSNGLWSHSDAYCKDIDPPKITCPTAAVYGNDPGKTFKRVTLPEPAAVDNSGKKPSITRSIKTAQHDFYIGRSAHEVVYTARDEAGLTDECTWYVKVKDTEKPKVLSCPLDTTKVTNSDPARVVWEIPKFKDNYDDHPYIQSDKSPGIKFPYGKSKVTYNVADNYGNNATCQFYISVSPYNCPVFDPPKHGSQSCNIKVNEAYEHHLYCTAHCQKDYSYVSGKMYDVYQCAAGQWRGIYKMPPSLKYFPKDTRPWVDCTEKENPEGVKKVINAYVGKCHENNAETLAKIKEQYLTNVNNFIISKMIFCEKNERNCDIENVKVYCGKSKRSGDTAMQVISIEIVVRDKIRLTDKAKAWKEHEMIKMDLDATEIAADQKIVGAMGLSGMHIEGYKSKPACRIGEVVHTDAGDGDELERSSCVKCDEGTYYDKEEEECIPCAAGTFQDQQGKTSCINCPDGTWTIGPQASNRTECVDMCGPGEYSQHGNGLGNCLACPIGTYQSNFRQSNCVKCPTGKTTKARGTASVNDCQ